MEQQVQDGKDDASDTANEEPQNQDGRPERAKEANHEVTEEGMQGERAAIQASDKEFPDHQSLEAIFLDLEPDTE